MKKRSVLYTWVIEFSILLILMAAMCVTLTLSAKENCWTNTQKLRFSSRKKLKLR